MADFLTPEARAQLADPIAVELGHQTTTIVERGGPPVMALDVGTSMGWALRRPGAVLSGTKSFAERRGESRGDRLTRFDMWLSGWARQGLTLIAYEQVMFHGKFNGVLTAHAYGQYEGVILMCASRHSIPVKSVPTATLKKAITGKGNAKKAGPGGMIEAIKARGFKPADDDEADAIGVLLWALDYRAEPQPA